MEQKENDMLLNVLENPSFNIQDFQAVGLNANNTSLQTQDTYANSPQIQSNPLLMDNKGQLDIDKLTKYYNAAAQVYNTMAADPKQDVNNVQVQYSKYDIWAPADKVDWSPQFKINTKEVNPDATSWGAIRVGEQGPRTKTAAELAESHKVYNPTTGEWEAAPEDSFFDNLLHVRALAQYDKDVDVNGIEKGQPGFDANNIEHTAGELKINPDTGTYYYEDIDGKNIHNRQILHVSDVLTKEDSPLNAVDFFDSDDIHKSPIGSFVKNAALVGSMFIPYVGPWVTGATIVQQAASFGSTLGKIVAGSDNELCNFVQGLSESTNFMNSKSEYSNQSVWTWENLFNMVGNTVAQLKQQRMLFEGLPKLVGMDGRITTKAGREAWTQDRVADLFAKSKSKLEAKWGMSMEDMAKNNKMLMASDLDQLNKANSLIAAAELANYSKQYYNVGATLSKAYMTMLTVNDMYDNAKAAGASDTAAMLTTLGYAGAEYALLSTGLGEWILPELRQNRMLMKGSLNTLKKDLQSGAFQAMEASAKTPADKVKFASKLINYGKKLFTADYAVGRQGTLAKTAVSTIAGGLGEGTEEISEDILQDFVSRCYNFAQELSGSNSRIHNTDWGSQYMMDFLGGFLGGGISNSALSFNIAKQTENMTSEKAIQNIVSMVRNPEQKTQLLKMVDKTELGNKNLSATQYIKNSDGDIIGFASGTKEDNQDLATKNLVKSYIDLVSSTLDAAGAKIDDNSLFDKATMKDLRFQSLYNSTMTGYLFQKFNDLGTQYLKVSNEMNQIRKELNIPDQKYKEDDPEVKKKTNVLNKYSKQLDEIQQQIQDIRDGKNTEMYMLPALLETSPSIALGFNNAATFAQYVKTKTGNDINEISDTELTKLSDEYKQYKNSTGKDDIINMATNYKLGALLMASKFADIQKWFNTDSQKLLGNQSELNAALAIKAGEENPEQPDEAKWLEEAQKLATAKAENKDKYGNIHFDETTGNIITQEQNPEATKLLNDFSELINNAPDTSSTESIINNIKDQVTLALSDFDSFINNGYLTPQTKETLIQRLEAIRQVFKFKNGFDETGSMITQLVEMSSNPELDTLEDAFYTLRGDEHNGDKNSEDFNFIDKAIDNKIQEIKRMDYTPIQEIANHYALASGQSQITFKDLMDQLQTLESATSSDISKFSLNEDTIQYIYQAKRVLKQLQSLVEGARDDDASQTNFDRETMTPKNNIWGINKTLNDIAKTSKDEKWKELPTISGELADALKIDISNLNAKLDYYLNLYGINKGQKLNSQTTITTNLVYNYYNKYKRFCKIVNTELPDDWDTTALDGVDLTFIENKISDENKLQLSQEDLIQLKKSQLAMENSIYEFFKANSDKDFSLIFQKFDIINNKPCLANDTTEEIDDLSFIGYIIANASVHSSTINQMLLNCQSIHDNQFIPSEPQIQAIKLALGNIINGDFTTKMISALKKAQKDKFTSISFEERVNLLQKLGYGKYMSNVLSTDTYGLQVFDKFDYGLFYNNITLCEALPGGGKTSAVDSLVCQLVNQINPDYLKGSWVSNTTEETTKKFNKDNLKIEDAKLYTKEQILKKISTWKAPDYKNGSTIDHKGRINLNNFETEFELNSSITDIPKVIFIDEIGMWTTDELQLLDKFAQKYGISVVATGDYYQSQTKYNLTLGLLGIDTKNKILSEVPEDIANAIKNNFDKLYVNISTDSNNLLHTPKIGFSFRTANTQQDLNQSHVLSQMISIRENPSNKVDIKLHYYENDDPNNYTLHGTKIATAIQVKEITDILDKLIPTLQDGEKIGYIYNDTKNEIYKTLMNNPKYKDHIQEYYGSAQGLEGRYWISELANKDSFSFLQDLYTNITRAKVGSILVTPVGWNSNRETAANISSITDIKDTETSSFKLDTEIPKYNNRYKKVLDKSIDLVLPNIDIIERNKVNPNQPPIQPTQPPTQPSTQPTTVGQTSQQDFEKWYNDSRVKEVGSLNNIKVTFGSEISVLNKIIQDCDAYLDKLSNYLSNSNITINEDQKKAIQDDIKTLQAKRDTTAKYISILGINMNPNVLDKADVILAPGIVALKFNGEPIDKLFNKWFKNVDKDYSKCKLTSITWDSSKPNKVTIEYKDGSGQKSYGEVDINDLDTNTAGKLLYYTSTDPEGDFDPNEYAEEENRINLPKIEDSDINNNLLFFSSTAFNLGVRIENGNYILSGIPNRVDGLNAFLTIDSNGNTIIKPEFSKKLNIKTPANALWLLMKLRGYGLNTYKYEDLVTKVSNTLQLNNISIRFALKSGNIRTDYTTKDYSNQDKDGWGAFDQLPGEAVMHQNSIGEQTEMNGRTHREFVMLIYSGNKLISEISLFKPNNPITKALQLGILTKTEVQDASKDFYKALGDLSDKLYNQLSQFNNDLNLATKEEDKKSIQEQINIYNMLYRWTQYYLRTSGQRTIQYLHEKSTPSNLLVNQGPIFQTDRGLSTAIDDKLITPAQVINLNDLKTNNPELNISKIMVAKTAIGNLPAGHIFVLISTDPDLKSSNKLLEQFEKQLQNPNEPKKVILKYVTAPIISTKEYINSLFTNGQVSLGGHITAFKLLQELFLNDNNKDTLIDLLTDYNNPNTKERDEIATKEYFQLKHLFADLVTEWKSDPKKFYQTLNNKVIWNNTQNGTNGNIYIHNNSNIKQHYLYEQFIFLLRRLSQSEEIDWDNDAKTKFVKDDKKIDKLSDLIDKSNIKIYYSSKLARNSNNGNFMEINTKQKSYEVPDNVSIANKSYTIYGDVASNSYRTTKKFLDDFFDDNLNNFTDGNRHNIVFARDNTYYLDSLGVKSQTTSTFNKETQNFLNNIKSNYNIDINQYKPTTEGNLSDVAKKDIFNKLLNDNNIIWFMDSNELKKLDDDQKRVINEATQNGNKSVYDFLKSSINSITYEVEDESVTIDKTDNSISYTKQSTGQLTDEQVLAEAKNSKSPLHQLLVALLRRDEGEEEEDIQYYTTIEVIEALQDASEDAIKQYFTPEAYKPYKDWLDQCNTK